MRWIRFERLNGDGMLVNMDANVMVERSTYESPLPDGRSFETLECLLVCGRQVKGTIEDLALSLEAARFDG